MFTTEFLDALGRWLRGWKQDPVARAPIAAALERHAAQLPDRFRAHDGSPVFRKRGLYRSEDQKELLPLILGGKLDEGSVTSWSSDLGFLDSFGEKFDHGSPDAVAGAIFRHIPQPDEIILNIPALWTDAEFVKSAEQYRATGGAQAKALFYFTGELEQSELVLRAPLRRDEIYHIFRPGEFDSLAEAVGAATQDARVDLLDALFACGIDLRDPGYRPPDSTQRIVQRVAEVMRHKLGRRAAVQTPHRPDGRRARLKDAVELGNAGSRNGACFEGWRRLHGPDGVLEGRWSDGTIVYLRRGFIWIAPVSQPSPIAILSRLDRGQGPPPLDIRLLRRERTPPFSRKGGRRKVSVAGGVMVSASPSRRS